MDIWTQTLVSWGIFDAVWNPYGLFQGTWKFDDRLLLSVSGVDRIQTIIAEVLRDIVEDDEREISVNMLQVFVEKKYRIFRTLVGWVGLKKSFSAKKKKYGLKMHKIT